MINLSPPKIFTQLFPRLLWRIPNSDNTIYLTFDDGPTQGVTPWVIDTLKKYNAKATFFCLGKNVEMHPDIFQRIIDEGHGVGNHSYSHLKGWETPIAQYVQDVDLANDILNTNLYRPPYGRIRPNQARILKERYKIVMWSLLSMDYSRWITPKRCARMVVNKLHPGAIIVFHDSIKAEENMRYALVKLLEEVKRRGWGFGVIE
ncbi:MAG: polysaccharide deacetylase family protein [Bacteroidales bacterium]|nr:polysaccharide deacetylase family protein [Bacteroidales bacterium]MDD4671386.1 polysaccharide deacetylase family protein [Bacteroidales bacterium]MDY0347701.1 polysaccharide deacetylase family protein [Tenuifilaceae bacterium]